MVRSGGVRRTITITATLLRVPACNIIYISLKKHTSLVIVMSLATVLPLKISWACELLARDSQ